MSAASRAKPAIDIRNLCRLMAEGSPMPIAAVEGAGHTIRYANPAFCRLVRKSKEEVIGSAFSSVLPAGDECVCLLDRVYRTGQAETHFGQETSAPEALCWSYAMWPVLAPDGQPTGVIVQVMESMAFHHLATAMNEALLIGSVRQHELTEAANGQLRAELQKRQHTEEVLRRANEDLKQFAFAATHDLQEPLRMITSYSQLLVKRYRSLFDEKASMYMAQITEGAERMAQLLQDLLAYLRLDEKEEREPSEPVDLSLIFQDAIENLEMAIEESGAIVTSGDLPVVQGDAAHFLQLFQNLIGNAIKYRGERSPRIHVSAERTEGGWRFAVADNGMGIAPEYHRQIFGVFKRLHGNDIPGTGIGLAICQRIIERCGGRIWLQSEPEQGTTFYFTLPKNVG
jgi:signal transduction histidine kinase